jgi:hypothetical protein
MASSRMEEDKCEYLMLTYISTPFNYLSLATSLYNHQTVTLWYVCAYAQPLILAIIQTVCVY